MPKDGKITLVTMGTEVASLKVGSGFCQVGSGSKALGKLPTSAAGRLFHAGGGSHTETGVCRQIICSAMGTQTALLSWSSQGGTTASEKHE